MISETAFIPGYSPTSVRRQEYAQVISPDVVFIIPSNSLEVKIPAHRSIVSLSPYLQKLLKAGLEEVEIIKTDPRAFEKGIDWLYTGNIEWETDPSIRVRELYRQNKLSLRLIDDLAAQLELPDLLEYCRQQFLKFSMIKDLINKTPHQHSAELASLFRDELQQQGEIPIPGRNFPFWDMTIQAGTVSILANRVILSGRSPYFRKRSKAALILETPAGTEKFWQEWVQALMNGTQKRFRLSDEGSEALTTAGRFSILQVAKEEENERLIEQVCELLTEREELEELSDGQLQMIEHIKIDSIVLQRLSILLKAGCKPRSIASQVHNIFQSDLIPFVEVQAPFLKKFQLRGNDWIEDKLISVLSQCTDLVSLNLKGCTRIKDLHLDKIMRGCQKLSELNIAGCIHVTAGYVDCLRKTRPGVKIINN